MNTLQDRSEYYLGICGQLVGYLLTGLLEESVEEIYNAFVGWKKFIQVLTERRSWMRGGVNRQIKIFRVVGVVEDIFADLRRWGVEMLKRWRRRM